MFEVEGSLGNAFSGMRGALWEGGGFLCPNVLQSYAEKISNASRNDGNMEQIQILNGSPQKN